MAETAHSPAPFALVEATENHGYVIVDAMGDSIGALAFRTGDHPPEEQRANALLFAGAADLFEAARDLIGTLSGEPDLDPYSLGAVATLKRAIAKCEGRA